jgi:histidyl-tRNA synthetase
MRFRALPGFRDFYPEELAARRGIEQVWHAASHRAGFQEWDGPPLESLELFTSKSGDEIEAQLYAFSDKGGRGVALRPEMTPTLARMVAARAAALPKPIKWYCVPQFFRYERQQRGRLREFYQWNVDVIGAGEVAADAEVIAVAIDALRALGLSHADVRVHLNDRRVVRRMLQAYSVSAEDEPAVLSCIDKLGRDPQARNRLEDLVGASRAHEILGWGELHLPREPEIEGLMAACKDYDVGPFVEPDFRVVRGLAYYTGPVWEIFDLARSLRSIAGGGRYDALIGSLGGPDLPAVGFGMGDVVLSELLAEKGLLPKQPARIQDVVVPIGPEMLGPARRVATRLRARGRSVDVPYAAIKLAKALKVADQARAERAFIVGPDEWSQDAVRLKDLASGEERVVPFGEL